MVEQIIVGLVAGAIDGALMVALGAIIRAITIRRTGGQSPPALAEFAWLIALGCSAPAAALHFVVLAPVAFIASNFPSALAAWWIAIRCQEDGRRGTTPQA